MHDLSPQEGFLISITYTCGCIHPTYFPLTTTLAAVKRQEQQICLLCVDGTQDEHPLTLGTFPSLTKRGK